MCVQAWPELHVFLSMSGETFVATTSKITGTRNFERETDKPCLV